MNVERFLYQVQQNLPKHEGVTVWIDDSAVKVGYGDTRSFEIRYPGGVYLLLLSEVKRHR